jgi:large subunit ribosomal protein L22
MAEVEIKAVSKFARISPLKVRRIVGTVKGKPVETGINTLKFMPQKAARMLEKVVKSALANAEQTTSIDVDNLVISNITADQGPMLKRFKARARGRGTRILKRTAHITVTLVEQTV